MITLATSSKCLKCKIKEILLLKVHARNAHVTCGEAGASQWLKMKKKQRITQLCPHQMKTHSATSSCAKDELCHTASSITTYVYRSIYPLAMLVTYEQEV